MMIHIAQSLRQEISKDMINLSERFAEQLKALEESQEHVEKLREIESRIGIAATAYRMATDIGDAQEIRKAASGLEKAKKERWSLKFQREQAIKELTNPIKLLNTPLIEQISFFIGEEIAHLPKKRVLMVTDTKMTNDPLNQGVVRVCQTNRARITEVRTLLLDGKGKLRSMNHSSLSQILSFVEGVEETINAIDFKKCDETQFRDSEYHDELALIEGEKSLTSSPKYHQAAERGFWEDQFDLIKQKVKRVMGG